MIEVYSHYLSDSQFLNVPVPSTTFISDSSIKHHWSISVSDKR